MISKSNKFIKYASIAALAIVALAASLSSSNINLGKNILRGRASDTIHGSITFSMSTGTRVVRSTNYYYTSFEVGYRLFSTSERGVTNESLSINEEGNTITLTMFGSSASGSTESHSFYKD